MMMMIAFVILNSSLVSLIEGLYSSNPLEFEFSGFRRNRADDLAIVYRTKAWYRMKGAWLHVRMSLCLYINILTSCTFASSGRQSV